MNDQELSEVFYFATVLVPELEENIRLREPFIENFNEVFSGLEDESKQKLKLLITLVSMLSFVYTFKRINKLDYTKRKKFVDKLFSFPYAKVVGGVNGLKALCFIAYYGIEEVWGTINYKGPTG